MYLLLAIPGWAVSVRRLHDINKSGWWVLISLILSILGTLGFIYNFMHENWWMLTQFMSGILSLYLSYCILRRGDPQANRFGPNPVPEE
nr:DUF805 domain-containing protein [Veillonella montpellierensis]